ncbi:hypothetical protein BG53_11805 [Paenibacillus darwinianus]|uniref:DUF2802 domain-containing protein n=1 Tax=Paenibacillus darwinianus TaxID=1380763 RepID=A0A9W5S2C2_9BACL|nr:hypothetical protein BG53_11805 [Paenibacillus darwinianus]
MSLAPWQLVVLLGAFAIVGALILPRRGKAAGPASNAEGMQTALEQFMENMEADNRELIETVTRAQLQQRQYNAERDERLASLERRIIELEGKLSRFEARTEERLDQVRNAAVTSGAAVAAKHPTAGGPYKEEDVEAVAPPIRERYAELFDMHNQGKSIEAIAKKVGMNKGEVMLILQLAKQEEERRV